MNDEQFEEYWRKKQYDPILDKIPYSVIEEHLKRRREETREYLKWVAR